MRVLVDGLSKDTGGVGSLIMNITAYAMMEKAPIEFSFLVPENSVYITELEKRGLEYYVVPSLTRIAQYHRCLKHLFESCRFDFVWINNSSKVNLLLPKMAAGLGHAKVIAHSHGVSCEETGLKKMIFSGLEHCFEKSFSSCISIPFACSEAAADHFYRDPELRSRTKIIHNGIFTEKFLFSQIDREKIRRRLGIQPDEILLGAVGRMTAVKNYGFLLELLSGLPARYKLLILGDGPDRPELEQCAASCALESRVILPGNVENVPEFLNAMDAFMMPSLHEGMPFSCIEAQASGLPCLVSDTLTKDLDIAGMVSYVKLNDITKWSSAVLALKAPNDRAACNQAVADAGFSIRDGYRTLLQAMEDHEDGDME